MCWSNLSFIMFRGWLCHLQNLSNTNLFIMCCIVQGPKVVKSKDAAYIMSHPELGFQTPFITASSPMALKSFA